MSTDPLDVHITFGKHRGSTVAEIPSGYLHWMLETFTDHDWEKYPDLLDAVEEEMARRDRSYSHWEE